MKTRKSRQKRRGGAKALTAAALAFLSVGTASGFSFSELKQLAADIAGPRMDDAKVQAYGAKGAAMVREFPSPPSLTGAAAAFLTAVQDSPKSLESILSTLQSPESPAAPPLPVMTPATAEWALTPGTKYRVALKPGQDERAPFDAMTPVEYVREENGDYIVKENGVEYPLSKEVFDLLPPYDTQSAWGRRRRRRTVRRRKTLRRKM